eukprot:CAMPEP_0114551806 /NCGR_PEP_ID=MMETSP0114-20121206/6795_1 /TAXON_ID=31324 /ORGANISM="Goniomonas sp, Strain m" /LENGTH=783 /DNA_ID=CAMNT_0001736655 /DNA_START=8 /DNA_END=2359 /DNA_ORIENTATION=-
MNALKAAFLLFALFAVAHATGEETVDNVETEDILDLEAPQEEEVDEPTFEEDEDETEEDVEETANPYSKLYSYMSALENSEKRKEASRNRVERSLRASRDTKRRIARATSHRYRTAHRQLTREQTKANLELKQCQREIARNRRELALVHVMMAKIRQLHRQKAEAESDVELSESDVSEVKGLASLVQEAGSDEEHSSELNEVLGDIMSGRVHSQSVKIMDLLRKLAAKLADKSCLARSARKFKTFPAKRRTVARLRRALNHQNAAATRAARVAAVAAAVARAQRSERRKFSNSFNHVRRAIRGYKSCTRHLSNTRRAHSRCKKAKAVCQRRRRAPRRRRAVKAKRVDTFHRTALHGQALAQATCTALNTRGGWTFAVKRHCSGSARTCAQVCGDRRGRGKDSQARTLHCFNSLHIYGNQPSGHDGRTGLKVYKYGGCGGGCGPNYCCCRNGVRSEADIEEEKPLAISAKQAEEEKHNGEDDSAKAVATLDVDEEKLDFKGFRSYALTAQVLAQATCTAINNRGGWTFAIRRTCGRGPSCAAVCKSRRVKDPQAGWLHAFNSLHVYSNRESNKVDQLGLKTYRYNGVGGGCGPNYCCCRNGRSEDEAAAEIEEAQDEPETDGQALSELEDTVADLKETPTADEDEDSDVAVTEDNEVSGFPRVYRFNRYNLDGQLLAQSVCSALAPGGWAYAVKRTCRGRRTCRDICGGTTESQARSAGNRSLQCVNSLHVYHNQPFRRDNTRGLKVYKYNSCTSSSCGPNYCCCQASYGARKLKHVYTTPRQA